MTAIMNGDDRNPWTTRSSEIKYENPWIRVEEHAVINPAGNDGIYGTVHFKNLAIGIIPLDEEDNTWIVGQYRYPLDAYSWEIVEGGGKQGADPQVSAAGELMEETGIRAASWEQICTFHTSNSVCDETAMIYVARGLSFGAAEPEETEQLAVKKIPFSELVRMVMNNEITDSLTVAGVLKLQMMRLSGQQ